MIKVLPSALRHGLSETAISYAWESLVRCRQRQSNEEPPRWIAIGILPDGRIAELVAFESLTGEWYIFHAMTPPTAKFINELGLRRG